MTPEDLIVKKFKKKVGTFLDSDDKDILEAYISMETEKRVKDVKWWATFSDWILTIGAVGLILLAITSGASCIINDADKLECQRECSVAVEKHINNAKESKALAESYKQTNKELRSICIDGILGQSKAD